MYNVNVKDVKTKISNKLEPWVNGLGAGVVIAVLSFLTFELPLGAWLIFSFGSSALVVFVFYTSDFAQPKNIFLGHLLSICVGILINNILPVSPLSLGLAVGLAVALMAFFKITHPPAAANPLIAIFANVSNDFILFPIVAGSLTLIILSFLINKYLFKRNYPTKWF